METVDCNLCGSSDYALVYEMPDRFFFPDEFFKVVECNHCGLGFVNPRPSIGEIGKYYPRAYFEPFSRDRKQHLRRYSNEAKYLLGIERREGPKMLLDVGCAEGDFPRFMKARGWIVEGVEVSSETAPIRDFKVYNQPLHEIPVERPTYDAVTAWAVIEHVHDPMAYFRKAGEVTKQGGLFVFLLQNFESLASRCLFCEDVPRHLYFFTEKTVKQYLEKTGFKLIRAEYKASIYGMVAVNWLSYLIKTKLKKEPFRFSDRHLTRTEWLIRKNLKTGLLSDLRYALAVPEAVIEKALMPLVTKTQILRKTFGTCTYVARKP